jgi:micrococcal nuclease
MYFAVTHVQVFTVPIETLDKNVQTTKMYDVVDVVDGDTIDIAINGKKERVRYIGMDTPEIVDSTKLKSCFGVEASKRNSELVRGKKVALVKDVSERDKYGRLLRYVYVDGEFVNLELVQEGFARSLTISPDVAHSNVFMTAERSAREKNLGLWATCKI